MDQSLVQRLEILTEAGEIDELIKQTVLEFCQAFEDKFGVKLAEENACMLVTHLAMALARIKRGEIVEEMGSAALEEIKGDKIYCELPVFYQKIEEKLDIEVPESEKNYIALHACALISKLNG